MSLVTIYHNPQCSKSRQTLALLESRNISLEIILYKEAPLNHKQLSELIALLDTSIRNIIRSGEDAYVKLNLKETSLSDEELIAAIIQEPSLLQRPIVVANGQARIGRPPECVLEIL